jgi:hypothetical protein
MSNQEIKQTKCMYCGKDAGGFASCLSCEMKVVAQVQESGKYDPHRLAHDNPEMTKAREALKHK